MNDIRESNNPDNQSVLGRLLEEISWVGTTIKSYREGGKGFENVLTAEVFQSLDFLPRSMFMGEIINSAVGADKTRSVLISEIESANFCLLPGSHYLIPSGENHQTKLPVQPDGLLETANVYGVIEAKRIKPSSFQPEQLAREFVLTIRDCNVKLPLLMLVLGKEPPINVKGYGRISIFEAIEPHIDSVLYRAERHSFSTKEALSKIDDTICWITWDTISQIVDAKRKNICTEDYSTKMCIDRLASSVVKSIQWHS